MYHAKHRQHEPIAFGREIYRVLRQMQGLTASFPFAEQACHGGRLETSRPRLWGGQCGSRGWQGPRHPPHNPAEHRDRSGGAAPAKMASLLAMELAARARGWKEVHRKRDHVAINPVKSNDVFSSIFS